MRRTAISPARCRNVTPRKDLVPRRTHRAGPHEATISSRWNASMSFWNDCLATSVRAH